MHHPLIERIEQLHTTELGALRIQKNLKLYNTDVVAWCKQAILNPKAVITRNGKNWYVTYNGCVITVHAHSYTIITAHPCF